MTDSPRGMLYKSDKKVAVATSVRANKFEVPTTVGVGTLCDTEVIFTRSWVYFGRGDS